MLSFIYFVVATAFSSNLPIVYASNSSTITIEDVATITQAPLARRTPTAQGHEGRVHDRRAISATTYAYSAIPYQVYAYPDGSPTRGGQTGYNICNATTAGLLSECQTMEVNSAVCAVHYGISGLHLRSLFLFRRIFACGACLFQTNCWSI